MLQASGVFQVHELFGRNPIIITKDIIGLKNTFFSLSIPSFFFYIFPHYLNDSPVFLASFHPLLDQQKKKKAF
jgi:hypothetical protein